MCGVAAGARAACHRLMGPHGQLLGPQNTPGILPLHEHDVDIGSWHPKPTRPLQSHYLFMHFLGRAGLPTEAIAEDVYHVRVLEGRQSSHGIPLALSNPSLNAIWLPQNAQEDISMVASKFGVF